MLASPASTTVRTSNGSTSSWSESNGARRVLRLADGTRSEARTRPVADRVVERRTDDRDVDLLAAQLGRIGDPRQLHERGRPDVGRQVEVVEGLERLVPAVVGREVTLRLGRRGARPRDPPETVATSCRGRRRPSRCGAAGSKTVVQRGAERMVAPRRRRPRPASVQGRRRNSSQAAVDELRVGEQVVGGLGDERGGEQRRLVGLRASRRRRGRGSSGRACPPVRSPGRGGWSGRPS